MTAPTVLALDVKLTDPTDDQREALEAGGEDPAEYVTVAVPSLALGCNGIAADGTLVLSLQLAIPPGLLNLQAGGGRVLDPQGQAAGLMQAVNDALTGCRPDKGAPPVVSLLVRKNAITATALGAPMPEPVPIPDLRYPLNGSEAD